VELYSQVRHAVRIEGLSRREAARRFGLDPRTVAKMLAFPVPPGYRAEPRKAAGQITMRKVDGWQTLATPIPDQPIQRAA